jgi:competence ComEA-like helix-hairpin-helix protein
VKPIFTPRERRAVFFLSLLFLIGGGIRLYRQSRPPGGGRPVDLGDLSPADSATIAGLIASSRELRAREERREQVSFPIDLNRASALELTALPGIGPVLAERIVAYREANGPFTSIDGLRAVKGIGDARIRELAPRLTLGP